MLAGVLIDHILHVASPPTPRLSVVSGLLLHLRALTKAYPRQTAEHFTRKLVLMHKNLKRGLNHGAAEDDAKTWPGLPELVFLRILGVLWPTSDMRHIIVSPTRLLMGSYLGLCKIRSFIDAASGLFLCTLFLQYENRSKRFVPEAINFLIDVIRCLSPRKGDSAGSVRCTSLSRRHDFGQLCVINVDKARTLSINRPHLVAVIGGKGSSAQTNVDLLGLAVDLLARFSEPCKALEGFVELYEPILQTLRDVDTHVLSPMLQVRIQFISVYIPAPNSIRGPNISNYRLHPEAHRVLTSSSTASKPSSAQTYPNSVIHSEV
jgi:nucleolar protein 14